MRAEGSPGRLPASVWVPSGSEPLHLSASGGDTALCRISFWGFLPETPLSRHFVLPCFVLFCVGGGRWSGKLLFCLVVFWFGWFELILCLCLWRHSQEILVRQKKNPEFFYSGESSKGFLICERRQRRRLSALRSWILHQVIGESLGKSASPFVSKMVTLPRREIGRKNHKSLWSNK